MQAKRVRREVENTVALLITGCFVSFRRHSRGLETISASRRCANLSRVSREVLLRNLAINLIDLKIKPARNVSM
jgi:hypothetical protein